jgi:SAM-dependent methyltransferase
MTMTTLVHPVVIDGWEKAYQKGMDKRYPTLELVRLEKWYFGGHPGRVLEYGFGTGPNLIHLLECGYTVDGVEASRGAMELVGRKLEGRPDMAGRARLHYLAADSTRLPYDDATFDYVVCLSVLSLLGSRKGVEALLSEFHRVMKPGARMIVDINAQTSEFATKGRPVGHDVFEFQLNPGESAVPTYCPSSPDIFRELLARFIVDDLGFAAHKYLHSEIYEYVACARKQD